MRSFIAAAIILFNLNLLKAADSVVCKGTYTKDSLKNGVWVCRYTDGRIQKKEHYKQGKLVSYMIFDNKGQIIETRNKRGKVKTYKPCGC